MAEFSTRSPARSIRTTTISRPSLPDQACIAFADLDDPLEQPLEYPARPGLQPFRRVYRRGPKELGDHRSGVVTSAPWRTCGRCSRHTTLVCGSSSRSQPRNHGATSGRPSCRFSEVMDHASSNGRVNSGCNGAGVVAASTMSAAFDFKSTNAPGLASYRPSSPSGNAYSGAKRRSNVSMALSVFSLSAFFAFAFDSGRTANTSIVACRFAPPRRLTRPSRCTNRRRPRGRRPCGPH